MASQEKVSKKHDRNKSTAENIAKRLAALNALYNSTVDEEEPEATKKFFKLMDEQNARKAATW